jgi:hypothetical protein
MENVFKSSRTKKLNKPIEVLALMKLMDEVIKEQENGSF